MRSMKITLEYDDAEDARLALDGHKWMLVVAEVDQMLRDSSKYEGKSEIQIEAARASIREACAGYGLILE